MAEKWDTTPFAILRQDVDEFILLVNKLIKDGRKTNAPQMVRVNDKTATGGWF